MKTLTLWALLVLALTVVPLAVAAPLRKCNKNEVADIGKKYLDNLNGMLACGADAFNEFKAKGYVDPNPGAPFKCSDVCYAYITAMKATSGPRYGYCAINGVRADLALNNLCKYNDKYTTLATMCSSNVLTNLVNTYYISETAKAKCGEIAVAKFQNTTYGDPQPGAILNCSPDCYTYIQGAVQAAPQCTAKNGVLATQYLWNLCRWNAVVSSSETATSVRAPRKDEIVITVEELPTASDGSQDESSESEDETSEEPDVADEDSEKRHRVNVRVIVRHDKH